MPKNIQPEITQDDIQKTLHAEIDNIEIALAEDVRVIAHEDNLTSDEKIHLIKGQYIMADLHRKQVLAEIAQYDQYRAAMGGQDAPCENCDCGHGQGFQQLSIFDILGEEEEPPAEPAPEGYRIHRIRITDETDPAAGLSLVLKAVMDGIKNQK